MAAPTARARRRAGRQFDPALAALLCSHAEEIFGGLEAAPAWRTVIAAEPALAVELSPDQLDRALAAIANFVDLKSPFTLGHSVTVAELAEEAGRRFLAARPEAAGELFGEARLPTLVQYDPGSRFFEVRDGTLLFSADNGIPLLRYHIADEGGLIGYQDMLAFCGRHGFDPVAELGGAGARGIRPVPFAYVFGRSHFTV